MQPLDWNTRMKIAAGIANGLNYLHHKAKPPVIYRDLKSSNILLDDGFLPKLSDFGLAKFGPHEDKSHVSTRVMGTYGYCAPEYAATGHLTLKSDVYSFGMVLLEIISGLTALDETRVRGKHKLLDWVRPMLIDPKNFLQLADKKLNGQFPKSVFCKTVELVLICVRDNAPSRPTMTEVVGAMDYLTSKKYDPCAA
ncbi:probable serine/threonine-protein kinase PBL7 isoform X1 [Olea europaea var. sylvestris]|uniref:probable serine/threonine-protein kinase PBL7 isoform X1 n=1 Tax=Olea europaea var. sylvestris TaxID=158386 RepID=UPI000C1CCFBD|nr:probable serine/threonine-protein kinase PBL7 isoform X1 [Olea europaea var. sylvestris]